MAVDKKVDHVDEPGVMMIEPLKQSLHEMESKKATPASFISSVIVLFILILIFRSCLCSEAIPKTAAETYEDKKEMAYILTSTNARKNINDPSSFDPDDHNVIAIDTSTYVVVCNFHAKNGFGGVVPGVYNATIAYNGGDPDKSENWQMKKLLINGSLIYGEEEPAPVKKKKRH